MTNKNRTKIKKDLLKKFFGLNQEIGEIKMSLTDDIKPGEARCPGHPTTKELIKKDKGGAPKALLEESYQFIGDEDIPYERYTSSPIN